MQYLTRPIDGSSFGLRLEFGSQDLADVIDTFTAEPEKFLNYLIEADGLLYVPNCNSIAEDPSLLVRLSYLLGPRVEDYTRTLTTKNLVHKNERHILVLANQPPSNRAPPPRPKPALTEDGKLPVQFPHRRGWHSDQSFRRPPPDISLFYAVTSAPKGQGQTLYANGYAAYEALDEELSMQIEKLEGLHALPWTGRSESSVRSRQIPIELLPHQFSQRQPLVRVHPVTGRKALFCCEDEQMDWVEGPIVGIAPGPDGDGGKLVYKIMSHFTQPVFVYAHEWNDGDLIIHDNRNVIHSATWYDAENHPRHMWRTTVMGNAGPEYEGEPPSWLPASGDDPTSNLPDQ